MLDEDSTLYDSHDEALSSHDEVEKKAFLQWDKPGARRKNRALIIICVILVLCCPLVLITILRHPSWTGILRYGPNSETAETGAATHIEEVQAEDISIDRLVNTTELGLKTGFTISDIPTVREYELRINHGYAAPDGVRKLMILANGQSPGPLIEANTGDTIRVVIHNDMKNVSSSIHFHGIDMKNSTWTDGVHGVTQCAIPPGQSFTYEFNVLDQRGTFWYHAHTSVQYTDGLFGPIVIHDPNEHVPPYTDDQILFVGDHYHARSTLLLESYLLPASVWSPDIPGVEPMPDNFLLNGQHVHDCSVESTTYPSPPDNPCSGGALSQTFTQANSTLRLRLISHSSFTSTWFSIDNHTLTLVEVDGVEVSPISNLRGVYLNLGQRLSVLVNTSNAPGSYRMRATMPKSCFVPYCPYVSAGLASIDYEATALLSYGAKQGELLPVLGAPGNRSNPYGVENNFARGDVWEGCDDMPFDEPKPARSRKAVEVGERNKHEVTFRFQEVGEVNRIFINRTSYSPLKDDAQLWQILDHNMTDFTPGKQGSYSNWGLRLDQQILLVPDANEGVQIAINSKDQMQHPFHLHGHSSQIVAWGPGEFEGGSNPETKWSLENPMRRDTVTVPAASHVVLRFRADNPGIWALHCHISHHGEGGMFVTLLERPKDLKELVEGMDPSIRELSQSFCKAR